MTILDTLRALLSPKEREELDAALVAEAAAAKAPAAAEQPEAATSAELLDLADATTSPELRIAEAMRTGNADLVARVRAECHR